MKRRFSGTAGPFLALLLAVQTCLSVLPTAVSAEEAVSRFKIGVRGLSAADEGIAVSETVQADGGTVQADGGTARSDSRSGFPEDKAFEGGTWPAGTYLWIAVLKDAWNGLPGEPGVTVDRPFYRMRWDYWPSDWNDTFSNNPAYIVDREKLAASPYFVRNPGGGNVWGISDPTGTLVKDVLTTDVYAEGRLQSVDWDEVLRRCLETGAFPGASAETHEIVPYVVKYQGDGEFDPGWHIDCVLLPKDRIQVSYVLNLPGGIRLENLITVPGGLYSTEGTLTFDVGRPSLGQTGLGPNDIVKGATFYDSETDARLTFLGWSTDPDAFSADAGFEPGRQGVTITQTAILYGVWDYEGRPRNTGFVLPWTGGIGTAPCIAAGAALMFTGLCFLAGRKRGYR